jgi:hypothetical protein
VEETVVALDPRSLATLHGTEQLISAGEWRAGIRADGRVLRPTIRDFAAAELACLGDQTHATDLQPLRDVWNDLAGRGFEPAPLTREELLAGVQYLPPAGNITCANASLLDVRSQRRCSTSTPGHCGAAQSPDQVAAWIRGVVDARTYGRHELREALMRQQGAKRNAVIEARRG